MIWTENTLSNQDKDKEIERLQKKVEELEKRNKELAENERLLECLRHAGVDNWEGWSHALTEFRPDEDEEE